MSAPTPTPRTDSAWAQTFDANAFLSGRGNAANQMRDECATLERELTAITAERDHLHAQLRALTLICGTNDANKFETWIDRANARAEKAEADLAAAKERLRSEAMDDYASIKNLQRELAIERARLNWLESPSGMDWQWEPERLTVSRASIDAAMTEA